VRVSEKEKTSVWWSVARGGGAARLRPRASD
jgi:hypothetical protein